MGPAKFAAVVDGGKGVLHVVEGDKAVVVTVNPSTQRSGLANAQLAV